MKNLTVGVILELFRMKYISRTNIYIYIAGIVVSIWDCSDLYHILGGVILMTCSNFIAIIMNYYRRKVSIFESDIIIPFFLSTLTILAALLYVIMAYTFFNFLVVHVPCHVHMILGCGLSVAFHFTGMNSQSIIHYVENSGFITKNKKWSINASTSAFLHLLNRADISHSDSRWMIKCLAYNKKDAQRVKKHFVEIGFSEFELCGIDQGRWVFIISEFDKNLLIERLNLFNNSH